MPIAMPTVARRKRKDRNKRPREYGMHHARIRIPADIADNYTKFYHERREVKASWPATIPQDEADRKAAAWALKVKERFAALRAAKAGQLRRLEHREVHALVGAWYVEFVARHEANPGSPEPWDRALDDFDVALKIAGGWEERDFDDLLSDPSVLAAIRNDTPAATDDPLIDRGFSIARAAQADRWLLDRGYALTPESRAAFLDALAPRYADAIALLLRRAKGDYSRDPIAETFPSLEPTTKAAVSIRGLWDQWVAEKKPAAGTIERWRPVIDAAQAHWPDLRRVTDGQARDWFRSLVTEDRSALTVRRTWLTACKTVCNWASDQGLLTINPFAKVKLTIPRKITTRESQAFTDAEARTILRATLAINVRSPLDAAKKWLPFVCAYRGPGLARLRSYAVKT